MFLKRLKRIKKRVLIKVNKYNYSTLEETPFMSLFNKIANADFLHVPEYVLDFHYVPEYDYDLHFHYD